MDPVERALVDAIRSHLNDEAGDRLRLILADWLEEHGRERDGWHIRYHILHKHWTPRLPRRRRPRPRHDAGGH